MKTEREMKGDPGPVLRGTETAVDPYRAVFDLGVLHARLNQEKERTELERERAQMERERRLMEKDRADAAELQLAYLRLMQK